VEAAGGVLNIQTFGLKNSARKSSLKYVNSFLVDISFLINRDFILTISIITK
jgi:hypothetical protein